MLVYQGTDLWVGLAAGESQADIESLSVLLGVDTIHEDLHRAVTMWRSYDSGGGQQEGTVGESCFVGAGRRPPDNANPMGQQDEERFSC